MSWGGRLLRRLRPHPPVRAQATAAVAASLATVLAVSGCTGGRPAAGRSTAPGGTATCRLSATLVPSCGAWWGAAVEPVGTASQVDALRGFEQQIGMPVPVAHFYQVGDALFPTAKQAALARDPKHPRVLFFNWRPATDRSWQAVAAGDRVVDARIDRLAARIRTELPQRFFLSILAEPEDEVRPERGSGYTAEDYRAMFRHVVTRLRSDGVTNAITVMNYIGLPKWVSQPWFDQLYPGDDVIDWLGFDRYLRQSASAAPSFAALVSDGQQRTGGFLEWAAAAAPDKPVMLAEWGAIADDAHTGLKSRLLQSFGHDASRTPQIKGFVYWASDRPLPVSGGSSTGTTQLTGQDEIDAFRAAVRQSYFTSVTSLMGA